MSARNDGSSDSKPRKEGEVDFQVHEDPWFRLQQKIGLYPRKGDGRILLRVVIFILVTWVPMAIWALWTKRALPGNEGEPLLYHFGIHSRFLVALPVLLVGERFSSKVLRRIVPQFEERALVSPEKADAFHEAIRRVIRLRDAAIPWVAMVIVVVIPTLFPHTGNEIHALDWARKGKDYGFGGWWYLHIARPLFQLVLFVWLWRLILVTILLRNIFKLGLDLVPTHSDKLGGMGFVEMLPKFFAPLAFASSVILAAHWAHEVKWHGAHVQQYHHLVAAFSIGMLVLCISPLFVCFPTLKKAKVTAVRAYGTLVAEHGRLVHDRWIHGQNRIASPLLGAPELGPVADVNTMFEAVQSMRVIPFGKKSILSVAAPILIPMLALYAMEIPLADLLGKIFKTLV